jgi:hypothetical protein
MKSKRYFPVITTLMFTSNLAIGSTIDLSGNYQFQKCTVNVINRTSLDISDYYEDYNDPFAFFTNSAHPGVTLPGPQRQNNCHWTVKLPKSGEIPFTWNSKNEQCILNGAYGYSATSTNPVCSTGEKSVLKKQDWDAWISASKIGKKVLLSSIPGTNTPQEVSIGFGHGVLNSPCGGITLVKNIDNQGKAHYAAVMQTGTRAWSYEISQPASNELANDNYGGTCYIPKVTMLDNDDVQQIMSQISQ